VKTGMTRDGQKTNMEVVEGVLYPGRCRSSVFGARSWMTQIQVELESAGPKLGGAQSSSLCCILSFFLSFFDQVYTANRVVKPFWDPAP
jgi:hypothetical protein